MGNLTMAKRAETTTIEQARAAKLQAVELFGHMPSLTGVGITRIGDGYGLKVNLVEAPAEENLLPTNIDGVPVRIEVVGTIKKQTRRRR
jgi:hypothetical protein